MEIKILCCYQHINLRDDPWSLSVKAECVKQSFVYLHRDTPHICLKTWENELPIHIGLLFSIPDLFILINVRKELLNAIDVIERQNHKTLINRLKKSRQLELLVKYGIQILLNNNRIVSVINVPNIISLLNKSRRRCGGGR